MESNVRALVFSAIILSATLSTTVSAAPPDWDIVGLRLGMTEDQALAALNAYAPDMANQTTGMSFSYSDGLRNHQTAEFLSMIKATKQRAKGDELIELYFSSPPQEQRVLTV